MISDHFPPRKTWSRLESEQREQLQRLHERWRSFNLPVQEELALHLRRFGLESALHATYIAERLHLSLLSAPFPMKPPPGS